MPSPFLTLAGWHDVFYGILDLLEPINDEDEDDNEDIYFATRLVFRSTLLSLALSCRAFLDPSLNKLWHDLDDIHPLLKLLPNYRRHDFTFHLTGDISPEAWARLQTYAIRVRDVGVSREDGFEPSVWPIILKQCQGRPLFPHVRKLSVGMWNAAHDSLVLINVLASPSLRDLLIYSNTDQYTDKTTIATITATALQEFALKSPGLIQLSFLPYRTIDRGYLMCISQFVQMEQLCLTAHSILDEDLLLMLARLRNLTHLRASIVLRPPTECGQLDLKDGFERLTLLHIELHCQPASLPRFILATSMPRLNDLCLRLRDHPADGFHTSFPSICRHIGPHTLIRLRVELGNFTRPPQFLMDLLESLLPFTKLEELQFLFEEHLPLRDEDLDRFAYAWPKLRILLLLQSDATLSDPDREPGSVERPTLHGLIELARGCPKLDCLCVPDLDATTRLQVDRVPLLDHGPLHLCIQNLVGAEDSERQLDVAVALDRLFPRLKLEFGLEGLPGYGDNPNPYLEDSENVSRLLRAMQIARRHYPGGV